jgi:hypothetical protein
VFMAERKQLLGQLSVAREDEARARRRLQKLEQSVAAGDSTGGAAGVLAARDAELQRVLEQVGQLREHQALTAQALERAEVRTEFLPMISQSAMRPAPPQCPR